MFFRREHPERGADSRFITGQGEASYRALGAEELQRRAKQARELMSPCYLCGRRCGVSRLGPAGGEGEGKGEENAEATGICKTGRSAVVSSYGPHFGEEPPITGFQGSGTIFFSNCNLRCIFCQNYRIAHQGEGAEMGAAGLAALMLSLQERGCHNINLVSPTHVVPQIIAALAIAREKGLNLPLVYNTGGYDLPETIELLAGIVDIYMPDMKFGSSRAAEICAQAPDYPEVNFRVVKEMHRQVGDLVTDERGVAVRGLLVRHLVLPEGLAGTARVMKFIAEQISKDTYVNIMDQYYPCHEAVDHPVLGRRIRGQEYRRALEIARSFGLTRLGR
ncbi:MAG: radical SAM protein [Firmicutes bacterium]|nr:radical SAM protein [Bacillota bacterium]